MCSQGKCSCVRVSLDSFQGSSARQGKGEQGSEVVEFKTFALSPPVSLTSIYIGFDAFNNYTGIPSTMVLVWTDLGSYMSFSTNWSWELGKF